MDIRMNYCYECGHKASRHEIGMNTPQTGRCLEDGCTACINLETPSREMLGDEVERLRNTAADKDRQIAVLTEALGHYADEDYWGGTYNPGRQYVYNGIDKVGRKLDGYVIAQNALAESQRIQESE